MQRSAQGAHPSWSLFLAIPLELRSTNITLPIRTTGKVGTTSGSGYNPHNRGENHITEGDGCRAGPCGEVVYWCGPLCLWEELAPWEGDGGWAGGAGGARLSRGAPGTLTVYTAPRPDVPYTPAIGCVLTSPGVAGTRVPGRHRRREMMTQMCFVPLDLCRDTQRGEKSAAPKAKLRAPRAPPPGPGGRRRGARAAADRTRDTRAVLCTRNTTLYTVYPIVRRSSVVGRRA